MPEEHETREAPREARFDELAKGLTNTTISRRRLLWGMICLPLAATIASVVSGVAPAKGSGSSGGGGGTSKGGGGTSCEQKCEDRYKEQKKECAKKPAGRERQGCEWYWDTLIMGCKDSYCTPKTPA